MDKRAYWLHLEQSLTKLVQSLSSRLANPARDSVIDFIDNREFGLALETIYYAHSEGALQLVEEEKLEIRRLGKLMKIDIRL